MKTFVRFWLPPVVLCGILFWQSCYATPHVLPGCPYQDKVLHAGVYGLLGILWVRAFNTRPAWRGRRWHLVIIGVALATLYGLSDEWHQSFVPARSADSADLLADFIGSAVGSLLYTRYFLHQP